jgi:transposase
VHRATIEPWVARYCHRGVEGLRGPEHDARGRPPKLQIEHLKLLRQTMLTPLAMLGYAFTAWTLARLADFLKKKTGAAVRIACRRPKHVLKGKRDEAAHDDAKTELEAIKKQMGRMRRKVVISQDETE